MSHESNIKGAITKRWSDRAQSYDCSPGHGIHSDGEKQTWLGILAGALDNKKKLKILDAGTGTGALALLLAEMGHEVFGIDLSDEMLKRAQIKAKAKDLKVIFEVADAENPPFSPESFDAIVNRHVLWTLPNPEKAVRAWNALLKPGGHLVIIDGNFKYMAQKTMFQEAWRFLAMPLVFLTEFRDPRMPGKDLDNKLPMRHRERPSADLAMLQEHGFQTDVSRINLQRNLSLLQYLKYGYSRHSEHQFVVKGVKYS
jgi:ubiquinone/menaquinone biosynthesis C-methylase UbiE